MRTTIYWLHRFDSSARLGIMARPRGDDWLDDEIAELKKQNVGVLISLLEPNEIFELKLGQEKQLCSKYGIEYLNFPIADRGVPSTSDKTEAFINYSLSKINNGISIVIHCRIGIGRSSIIAGSILLKTGQKAKDIFFNISKVRGLQVPDTYEQIKWLENRQ